MNFGKILGGNNFKYLLAAIGAGAVGGYLLAQKGVFSSNYTVPANLLQTDPNFVRGLKSLPDLTNEHRWNTINNTNLEINVPLDVTDRMATIQGAYGEQYSYIGTP